MDLPQNLCILLSKMAGPQADTALPKNLKNAVASFEREYIKAHIRQTNGNMSEAARQLGLERSNLYKKVKKLKIDSE